MAERRATYLIQDPYDTDAIQFIETIDLYYGLRPICFYTDPKGRYYGERMFPILTSDLIELSVDVRLDDLAPFVEAVTDDYDVIGVVPYREDTVEVAADLCELVGIAWNDPDTLRRFRDKHAQKSYLRATAPSIRVPACRLVHTAADLSGASLPSRFVLKPNDGMANRSVGIFDADEVERAAAHIEQESGPWILEEYIDGVEYHIDGQVREAGDVEALAIYEYRRVEVNGCPTVYDGEVQCLTTDPQFEPLADYTVRLLTATGLRRCPFHLEVMVDDDGPCLIDLGARFPSEGGAHSISRLHPGRPDAFAIAAHDYLGLRRVATGPADWEVYDEARTVLVYGISREAGSVATLSGVDEVEALPEFVRWAVKPRIGDALETTKELRGAPYIVELRAPADRFEALDLIGRVRELVMWNVDAGRLRPGLVNLGNLLHRARRKSRWLLRRASAGTAVLRTPVPARDLQNSPSA